VINAASPAAPASSIHGLTPWKRVAENAVALATLTPGADLEVGVSFALLHDAFRVCDGDDPDHGPRAAHWADTNRELLGDIDTLVAALAGHADGHISDDPTIGVCWDADRLDLGRVGITPDAAYLSTNALREFARASMNERMELECRFPNAQRVTLA
jgi:uncharacterized protein